jgi:hypothetical protein
MERSSRYLRIRSNRPRLFSKVPAKYTTELLRAETVEFLMNQVFQADFCCQIWQYQPT